jgi:hypothetical protein
VCWLGLLAAASAQERIGLLRTYVTSGVLCAVRCFPCLLDFAPLSLFCHDVEYQDLDDVVFLFMSLCKSEVYYYLFALPFSTCITIGANDQIHNNMLIHRPGMPKVA